jgi:ADP-heptose:LPS heptosyltransferase
VRLALVTGEAEQERGITAEMVEGWRGIDFLHWDQLPLAELAARLSQAAAFIGHDSGISHLAAASGVACLLFFGPTDPATWAPRNAGVQVFTEPSGDLAQLAFEAGYARMQEFIEAQNSD